MPSHRRLLTLIAGAALLAAFMFALLVAPGFLSDPDSTVLNAAPRLEAVR